MSDADDSDEITRLYSASYVLRLLARRLIAEELGVSDSPHSVIEIGELASSLSFRPTICAANSAKATRLIANTSIRMLRYGATVSWPSTSWRSDNGTSVAYPRPLHWRRRFGRWLDAVLATTLAAFRAQV